MPTKESSWGKESKDRKGGPCAGNCHMRSSRIRRVTVPIHVPLRVPGDPLPSLHISPRKVVASLRVTSRCNGPTCKPPFGLQGRQLQGRLKRARLRNEGFCGPVTRLVIIFALQLAILLSAPTKMDGVFIFVRLRAYIRLSHADAYLDRPLLVANITAS